MKNDRIILVICTVLQLMFSYAVLSKWMDFGRFKASMLIQPLYADFAILLVYVLPPFELIIVILLFYPYQKIGLWLSVVTMASFAIYILFGLLHIFKKMPCSCGGILGSLSNEIHFLFNIFFLFLSISGLYILKRKEAQKS